MTTTSIAIVRRTASEGKEIVRTFKTAAEVFAYFAALKDAGVPVANIYGCWEEGKYDRKDNMIINWCE